MMKITNHFTFNSSPKTTHIFVCKKKRKTKKRKKYTYAKQQRQSHVKFNLLYLTPKQQDRTQASIYTQTCCKKSNKTARSTTNFDLQDKNQMWISDCCVTWRHHVSTIYSRFMRQPILRENTISYVVSRIREVTLDIKEIIYGLYATKYYCTLTAY